MDELNLNDYYMVQPTYIKKTKSKKFFYDIEVKDDNTFFISTNKFDLLTHNCDGYHIASLIINFFNNWFPEVISRGHLFILNTPLLTVDQGKTRKYFYSMEQFRDSKINKTSGIRYLKGLGSYDLKDWDHIFSNLNLDKIGYDEYAVRMLNMAFGDNANLRKRWLERIKG